VSLAEAFKSLPPEYQPVVLPHLLALMDVPDKEEILKAIQEVKDRPSPEMEKIKADNEFRDRELALRYNPDKLQAEIASIVAKTVQTGVQSAFSAMQAASQIAQIPQIAPVADAVMMSAGYQAPTPAGVDPNYPQPEVMPVGQVPPVQQNTSPTFPPVPQQADSPMQGIETSRTTDNIQE